MRNIYILLLGLTLLIGCNNTIRTGHGTPDTNQNVDLYPVEDNSKWGYIDSNGDLLINPQFDSADDFSEGYASIEINNKFGYIDKAGKVMIKPEFDYAKSFSEGIAVVRIGINPNTDLIKYGFINKKGEILWPSKNNEDEIIEGYNYDYAESFSDGLALVRKNGKTGYIDKNGDVVIDFKFSDASSFSNDIAAVVIDGKRGYINKRGEFVIKPQYLEAQSFNDGLARVYVDLKSFTFDLPKGFSKNCACGYIDINGKFIIKPSYIDGTDYKNGVAIASRDDTVDLIDDKGRVISQISCIKYKEFSEDFAPVQTVVDNSSSLKWGYIDKSGKLVIKPQFDGAELFEGGLARVRVGDKYGYINKNGQYVWKPSM